MSEKHSHEEDYEEDMRDTKRLKTTKGATFVTVIDCGDGENGRPTRYLVDPFTVFPDWWPLSMNIWLGLLDLAKTPPIVDDRVMMAVAVMLIDPYRKENDEGMCPEWIPYFQTGREWLAQGLLKDVDDDKSFLEQELRDAPLRETGTENLTIAVGIKQ